MQWHDKAVDPPGDSRSEIWFIYHLGRRLKQLYAGSTDPHDAPIQALTWDYPETGARREPSAEEVLKEINGYTWPDRKQVGGFKELKDDGCTACGCWIYSGVCPQRGPQPGAVPRAGPAEGPGTHLGWGFAWPANRRILYNRASADPEGKPWSERKKLRLVGRGDSKEWTATTRPTSSTTSRPTTGRLVARRRGHGCDRRRRSRSS